MPQSTIVAAEPQVPARHWPVPEERRTVTVLFVDIVGSTALVDRLDPEDVRELQRAYFDTVARVLRRWHGVVEKYIGDAVMALFGARESDGFDAYRAVRAGLEIQQALDRRPLVAGTTIRVRVGVATGEAVVDLAAARDGGHGAASGAVITTAARLQEYAPPAAVVVCAATHRATAGLVKQRRLTPVTVPNRVPPMGVWHAVGPATPPVRRHDGPLVGRRRELATARDQIVRAVRERSPRWVSLVGPSGSGRSRLLHELTRAVGTVDGTPVRWCVASCPPYPDQPLAPVADLVRGLARAGAGEPLPAVREPLAAVLAGLLAPARLAAARPALERLLAAPDGTAAAAEGVGWCQEVLLRLAARGPVVVAVDDLDRAAPAVDRFLHGLFIAAAARGLPLVVVALHTPDRADALAVASDRADAPAAAPDRRCRVSVGPLAPVQSGRLLRHLLARAGQQVSLVDRLLPLVGGLPGHAEAYVRSLVDGADPVAPPVPDDVRRAVGAELDRLDGVGRAVMMAAATLGARFTPAAVERLLGWTPGRARPLLYALVEAGLVVTRPAGTYAVQTPALRQVAADRLPRRVRARFAHRAVGADPVGRAAGAEAVGHVTPAPHRTDAVRPAPLRAARPGRPATVPPSGRRSPDRPEAAPRPVDPARPAAALSVVGPETPRAAIGPAVPVGSAGPAGPAAVASVGPRRPGRSPATVTPARGASSDAPVAPPTEVAPNAGPVPPVRRRGPGAARDGHPAQRRLVVVPLGALPGPPAESGPPVRRPAPPGLPAGPVRASAAA
ncbi:adenylate/guanylate cyclase domain-containing protein [Micromonospora sp. WMMD812]|uniref:AAA family ATPase n=1 Tax=Micromonospora sp. WMMD812 TaxID=3015152 RepID=UPI00248BBE40|nr:adenylate/guanylate cyclase domain-containing protein [Micromonospora sp. WMMD812]WBB68197.1 AAA family ATPase [Micromonospora sp. WMMD812]